MIKCMFLAKSQLSRELKNTSTKSRPTQNEIFYIVLNKRKNTASVRIGSSTNQNKCMSGGEIIVNFYRQADRTWSLHLPSILVLEFGKGHSMTVGRLIQHHAKP